MRPVERNRPSVRYVALALLAAACGSSGAQTEAPEQGTRGAVATATAVATAEPVATSTTVADVETAPVETAAASATTPALPDGPLDSVSFVKRGAAVGDIETSERVRLTKMKGTVKDANGKQVQVESEEHETTSKTEECLKVDGKDCGKLRVTYTTNRSSSTLNGQQREKVSPTSTKSYVVEKSGAEVTVTMADGSAPPPSERDVVAKDYQTFGKSTRQRERLPDKPVKVGDSLEDVAKVIAEESGGGDMGMKVKQSKVVVKSLRVEGGRRIATLEMTLVGEGEDPKKKAGKAKVTIKGTIDLLVDGGHAVSSELGGPIEITLPEGKGKIAGQISDKSSSTYRWR